MPENKSNNILQFILNNIHSVSEFSNPTSTVVHKKENLKKMEDIIDDTLNNMYSSSFSMNYLQSKIVQNKYTQQNMKDENLTELIETVIANFNTSKHGDLVYIGPKELNIVTTRKTIEEEIELIKLATTDDNRFELAAPIDIIKEEIKKKKGISDEQQKAVYACTENNSMISLVEGYAGAGKSYTMGAVTEIHKKLNFLPVGITLSWNAAKVLQNETRIPCYSVKSFNTDKLKIIDQKITPFNAPTMIIVDEAGLVNVEDMLDFLRIMKQSKYKTKIILSGDTLQLNPINSSNSLELIKRVINPKSCAVIKEIRRQYAQSHREAVLLLKDGYSGEALYIYQQQEMLKFTKDQKELMDNVITDYFTALRNNPNESSLIIGLNNELVDNISRRVRDIMLKLGKVDSKTEISISTPKMKNKKWTGHIEKFAVGDKIAFRKNDKSLALKNKKTNKEYEGSFVANRTNGRISKIEPDGESGYNITVDIEIPGMSSGDSDSLAYVTFNTKKYLSKEVPTAVAIELNYAITAYSSQGQTVQRVFLIDGEMMNRRYAYVTCSRHREAMTVYFNKMELNENIAKVNKKTIDEVSKTYKTIDYLNFASSRWGREEKKNSSIIKLLNVVDDINEMNIKNPNLRLTLSELPSDFNRLYNNFNYEKIRIERSKTFIMPPNNKSFDILDTKEYYKERPLNVNIDEVLDSTELAYNKSLDDFENGVPVKLKNPYELSDILTVDLFKKLKGKYFDIGLGGEIRMISKIDDVVISKYNINGDDVLQVGYPYIISNGADSSSNDIYIIKDLNKMFEFMQEFYLNENNNRFIPQLIWGTNDTDYEYLINAFGGQNIYMFGDDDFKELHLKKISNAIKDFKIPITFKNVSMEILNKIKDTLYPGTINNFKIDSDNNFFKKIDLKFDEQQYVSKNIKVDNEIEQTIKDEKLCNESGRLNNDILHDAMKYAILEKDIDDILKIKKDSAIKKGINIINNLSKTIFG